MEIKNMAYWKAKNGIVTKAELPRVNKSSDAKTVDVAEQGLASSSPLQKTKVGKFIEKINPFDKESRIKRRKNRATKRLVKGLKKCVPGVGSGPIPNC